MADSSDIDWAEGFSWREGQPIIEGHLEISRCEADIFIGGDPKGLYSLGSLLIWLANLDQRTVSGMPDGERYHLHLHRHVSEEAPGPLTPFSSEAELCRLDAKGTGDFPEKYARGEKR